MSSKTGNSSPGDVRVQKIYTRSGDKGKTRLLSGETLEKDDLRVRTSGALDELQSHLGLARALLKEPILRSMTYAVQKDLFVAGSKLASTSSGLARLKRRLDNNDVSELEAKIDGLTDSFGTPNSFVIPGDSADSAALHVARSVCRRVEGLIVQLNRSARSYHDLIVYFNRLSDLLFVMAWSATVGAVVESVLEDFAARR